MCSLSRCLEFESSLFESGLKRHLEGSNQMDEQPNNPLHGVKLADIVEHLVETYGWEELGLKININCFNNDPSVKSSLKFLRKTPWAREKVERLYLYSIGNPPPRLRRDDTSGT